MIQFTELVYFNELDIWGLKLGHSAILEKPCVQVRSHIFHVISINLLIQYLIFSLVKPKLGMNLGYSDKISRSLGQMLEKTFVHIRDLIFVMIFQKCSDFFCLRLSKIQVMVKTRSLGQLSRKRVYFFFFFFFTSVTDWM